MLKLENRIDALERKVMNDDELTVWIISFNRPGPSGPIEDEPIAFVGNDGERWNRQPGETLEQLKARASREVKRGQVGIATLREVDGDDEEDIYSKKGALQRWSRAPTGCASLSWRTGSRKPKP